MLERRRRLNDSDITSEDAKEENEVFFLQRVDLGRENVESKHALME